MLQTNENIQLVEQFIEGIKEKNIDKLPLHVDVLLYSPLKPGHIIKGRASMREFLSTKAFPSLPITGANIEKHISKENCVCTLWELYRNKLKNRNFGSEIFSADEARKSKIT